jgi:hypothetical protein
MATHTTLSADAQFQLDTLIWTAVQQVFEEPLNSSDEPISLLEQFLTRANGHPQLPYQDLSQLILKSAPQRSLAKI